MNKDFLNIKEFKTIHRNEWKHDNDKIIFHDDLVNEHLQNGWIILDIFEGDVYLGLPNKTDKSE